MSQERCRCEEVELLWDAEAETYAKHLTRIEVRDQGWAFLYECPVTDWLWLEDRPMPDGHGGGPLRLCRLWKPPGAG